MESTCTVEGCLCQKTNQPVTEAVYGKKSRRRHGPAYESRGGVAAIWRRISDEELSALADRFPKARRFAERRKKA